MIEPTRSYTNSDGIVVPVFKDHLDRSVEIKLELQNASPSRKCNWKLHKEYMQLEGFTTSDINESYRCMIKSYQKEIGKLHNLPTHVDLVAQSKLESIKQAVGELYYERRSNQEILAQLNKLKREFTRTAVIAEEVRNAFLDELIFEFPSLALEPRLNDSVNKAVVVITDWHIGAVVDNVLGNYFNFEIAQKRMLRYLNKVVTYCKTFQVTDVVVVSLGDMTEQIYMRARQHDGTEMKLGKQIVKATQIIIDFLVSLSQYVNVEFASIAGNHDRLSGRKDESFDDDNVTVVINDSIQTFIAVAQLPKLRFIQLDDKATEINLEIHGRKIKCVHGHLDNGNKPDRIKQYISMENEMFDCLIYGHLHRFHVQESDNGRLAFGVGSLMGRNSFSKGFGGATDASQGILIVTGDGDMLPLPINLQVV